MDEQMPLWRLLTAFLLLSHFGCAGIDQSVDPSGASEPADPAALPGEARAFASDSKHGGDAVSDARERIIGTWIRTNHGSASTHLVYLVTPIASEIEFHSDGTFRARYEGEELEMLRRYCESGDLGPIVTGEYKIMGRSFYHDLGITPVFIRMDFGPERRSLEIHDDALVLGKVGDSWQGARYRRSADRAQPRR